MSEKTLNGLIEEHERGVPFTALDFEVTAESKELWVKFIFNPQRFLPVIFDGEWAFPKRHPEIGSLRIVRIMTGNDGVTRVIGRQAAGLYAYPWIGEEN